MENKTAVQFIEEEFEKFIGWNIEGDPTAPEFTVSDMYKTFQKAIELEKQKSQEEFERGFLKCVDTLKQIIEKGTKNEKISKYNFDNNNYYLYNIPNKG
jgi:hypothetical protein